MELVHCCMCLLDRSMRELNLGLSLFQTLLKPVQLGDNHFAQVHHISHCSGVGATKIHDNVDELVKSDNKIFIVPKQIGRKLHHSNWIHFNVMERLHGLRPSKEVPELCRVKLCRHCCTKLSDLQYP